MTATREVDAARVERQRRTARLYTVKHAPRCTVCRGPMVALLMESTHPACDPSMPELLRLDAAGRQAWH